MAYEDFISEFEDSVFPSTQAIDAGADALTFVANLNNILRENGAKLPEEPDVDQLGTVLDGVFAELAAASIFLSEKSFMRVPKMLRSIADALVSTDVAFTDPTGETAPSVPTALVRGYRAFATRIESSRVQKAEIFAKLKKFTESSDTP
jgi:hypothetical protein